MQIYFSPGSKALSHILPMITAGLPFRDVAHGFSGVIWWLQKGL